jgi:hypothetical protein
VISLSRRRLWTTASWWVYILSIIMDRSFWLMVGWKTQNTFAKLLKNNQFCYLYLTICTVCFDWRFRWQWYWHGINTSAT